MFYDSGYDDAIKPYDIDIDTNIILISATRTRPPAFHMNDRTRFPMIATPSGDKSPVRIAQRIKRIFKDTGLNTIVILLTSSHPTPLKHRYEGYSNYPGLTFYSNITSAVAKYASRCALVQVKICSSGLAC